MRRGFCHAVFRAKSSCIFLWNWVQSGKETQEDDPMKVLYCNGAVYTGELPLQQAFLVEDGKFKWIGTDREAANQEADQRIDLEGHFVCPGFIDSHMHVLNYGQTLSIAPLSRNTKSLEEMIQCLKETAPGQGGWILGRGWNQDYFTDVQRMPNRWDLDRVSTDFPVCATRACGHALAVNSKALEILGITADTPQVEGGQIVMENGVPNGVFFDNAMDLVTSRLPAPDKARAKDMIRTASRALNAKGITGCHSDDFSTFQNLDWHIVQEAYRELEDAGELTLRIYEQSNFADIKKLESFVQEGNKTGCGTSFYRIGPLKLLGDGALGARTAYLSTPYKDDPENVGLSVFTPDEFGSLIGFANSQGMQVAVHCIGDACLDLVLNSIDKALSDNPREDHRHGIVHCQITRPDQLKRIAQMGLHVYCQSIFLDYDIHIVSARVGEETAQTSYSWKTLKNMGVTVSNGSDCPVETPDVLSGIQCAVTRCDLAGNGLYLEKEAFTVQEALDSYTKFAAYASFEENIKGQIKPEMLADFVVLGRNPFAENPFTIKNIPVMATYLGGKKVY